MDNYSAELVRIPLSNLIIEDGIKTSIIDILSLTEIYSKLEDRENTIPIKVRGMGEGLYKIIDGHHIFYALQEAGKEWALALKLPRERQGHEVWEHEIGFVNQQLNICTLSIDQISLAFEYLHDNVKPLSKIKVDHLVEKISRDSFRIFWSSLDPLLSYKGGVTTANLKHIKLYLTACPDLTKLNPISPIAIHSASEEEIEEMLQRLSIEPGNSILAKSDLLAISRKIVADPERIYWSDEKDLKKAKIGITASNCEMFLQGFKFTPLPAPSPNKSKFLLSKLSLQKLRNEAEDRGLDHHKITKVNLVKMLCE